MKNPILTLSTVALIAVGGIAVAQQTTTDSTDAPIVTQENNPNTADTMAEKSRGERGDRDCNHDGERQGRGHHHDRSDRHDHMGDDDNAAVEQPEAESTTQGDAAAVETQ